MTKSVQSRSRAESNNLKVASQRYTQLDEENKNFEDVEDIEL